MQNKFIFVWNNAAGEEGVWYKTKFGSQILATNFGVFFCNIQSSAIITCDTITRMPV